MSERYLGRFTATSTDGRDHEILVYDRSSSVTSRRALKVFRRPNGQGVNAKGNGVFEIFEPSNKTEVRSDDPLSR